MTRSAPPQQCSFCGFSEEQDRERLVVASPMPGTRKAGICEKCVTMAQQVITSFRAGDLPPEQIITP